MDDVLSRLIKRGILEVSSDSPSKDIAFELERVLENTCERLFKKTFDAPGVSSEYRVYYCRRVGSYVVVEHERYDDKWKAEFRAYDYADRVVHDFQYVMSVWGRKARKHLAEGLYDLVGRLYLRS